MDKKTTSYTNAIFDIENVREDYKHTEDKLDMREEILLVIQGKSRKQAIATQCKRVRESLSDIPETLRAIATRLERISERPEAAQKARSLADSIEGDTGYSLSQLADMAAELSENAPLRLKQLILDLRLNVRAATHGYQMVQYLERTNTPSAKHAIRAEDKERE